MMNLIPPHGEVIIRREYVLRVSAALAILFGSVGFVLAVGMLPTYILVNAQIEALKVETGENTDMELLEGAENEIRQVKEVLAQLRSVQSSSYASDMITSVETLAPKGITFQTFTLGYNNTGIEHITVAGVATTREVLTYFKKELESSDIFLTAEVPIADLAKDTNLPFTMTITISPTQ